MGGYHTGSATALELDVLKGDTIVRLIITRGGAVDASLAKQTMTRILGRLP